MGKSVFVAGIVATALFAGSGAAFSQETGCTCLTPLSSEGVVGQVLSADGQVLASQAGGLGPAPAGSDILLGSQVVTGPAASASINVGTCNLDLAANSEVTIASMGQDICVRVSEVGTPAGTANTTTAGIPNAPLAIFGAVSAGAALGAAIGGGDDEASP